MEQDISLAALSVPDPLSSQVRGTALAVYCPVCLGDPRLGDSRQWFASIYKAPTGYLISIQGAQLGYGIRVFEQAQGALDYIVAKYWQNVFSKVDG